MKKYRKFVLICDSFPPAAMGHAQRVAKLCKYLPRVSDWLPTVFCGAYVPETGNDLELAAEIPNEIDVFRIPAYESNLIYKKVKGSVLGTLLLNGRKFYSFPDHRIDWARKLVKAAVKRFPTGDDFEAILASGPPRSSYVAGYWLARQWKKPLIIDMRDPWNQKYLSRKYTPLHHLMNKLWEKRIYKFSSIIIANTEGNREMLLRENPELNQKIVVIPNGFDPDDLNPSRGPSLKKEDRNDQINLLYMGGLRGDVAGKGVFEEPLLKLIKEVRETMPEFKDKIKLHFVGSDGNPILKIVKKFGLEDTCLFHGQVSCRDVGRPLAEADICVLIINPQAEGSGWIPAKTYYYLASEKPIIALIPECHAAEFIKKYFCSYLILNIENIENEKCKLFLSSIFKKGTCNSDFSNKSYNLDLFSRKFHASKIADLLSIVANKNR